MRDAAKVFTWLGLYGHRLQKGTQLWAKLPGAETLTRKMTRRKRTIFQKRKLLSKKNDYTKHANGTVSGGKDLQSTSVYPMGFCRAVFAVTRWWFVNLWLFSRESNSMKLINFGSKAILCNSFLCLFRALPRFGSGLGRKFTSQHWPGWRSRPCLLS